MAWYNQQPFSIVIEQPLNSTSLLGNDKWDRPGFSQVLINSHSSNWQSLMFFKQEFRTQTKKSKHPGRTYYIQVDHNGHILSSTYSIAWWKTAVKHGCLPGMFHLPRLLFSCSRSVSNDLNCSWAASIKMPLFSMFNKPTGRKPLCVFGCCWNLKPKVFLAMSHGYLVHHQIPPKFLVKEKAWWQATPLFGILVPG